MNEKDILKKIKGEAAKTQPNIAPFIRSRYGAPFRYPKPKPSWNLISLGTILAGMIIIAVAIAPSIQVNPSSSSGSSSNTSDTTPSSSTSTTSATSSFLQPVQLQNDKQAISIAAVSTSSLLTSIYDAGNAPLGQIKLRGSGMMDDDDDHGQGQGHGMQSVDFDAAMDKLAPYLPIVEQLITTNNVPTVVTTAVPESDAFYGVYAWVDTYEVFDMLGNPIAYKLYYTMTLLNEGSSEDESQYEIAGVLAIGSNTYAVEGRRTVEIEDDKTEETLVFKANLIIGFDGNQPIIDPLNYVLSRYVFDDEETKYLISNFADGELLSTSQLIMELEDDEIKVVLHFEDDTSESTFAFKYEIEYDEETSQEVATLKVMFRIQLQGQSPAQGMLRIVVTQDDLGNFIYALKVTEGDMMGHERDEDRHDPHDEDEEDEEDDEDDED